MRYCLLFSILILNMVLVSPALAIPDDGNRGTGGGTCDLTDYKESLFSTESQGSGGYEAANSIGATGRYQFMPGTAAGLSTYKNADANCKTMGVRGKGLAQQACAPVQEAMMDEFTMNNLKWLKKNCPEAQAAVDSGKTVTGYKKGGTGKNGCKGQSTCSCRVSWSGILAGAHLGGASGICTTLKTGADVDDGHTSRLFYVCEHRDLPVPGEDCSPKQYPLTETPESYEPWPNADGFTPSARTSSVFQPLGSILKKVWVAAFQLMTEQLVTNMMHQAQIIGTFFDAKHQLETQRLLQKKYAEAHKDYHPSEQMCTIGTAVRDLANTEKRAELTKTSLTNTLLDRALATGDIKTIETGSDQGTRREEFKAKFCNKKDNTEDNEKLCGDDVKSEQVNADVNFTQTIDNSLTIELDLLDGDTKPEEENLFALLDYIFMHENFPWLSETQSRQTDFPQPYQDMRSITAIRSVAQNSFAEIIAQKTQGPKEDNKTDPAAPFIKALMKEMGVEETDIEKELGERPSYYAQMEVLTKKIYQHPEFISNLYDKPANVKRIIAAMTAIKVMQDRDIHKALMRREMLMSMLLEIQLRYEQQDLENRDISDVLSGAASNRGSEGFSGGGGGGGGGGGF